MNYFGRDPPIEVPHERISLEWHRRFSRYPRNEPNHLLIGSPTIAFFKYRTAIHARLHHKRDIHILVNPLKSSNYTLNERLLVTNWRPSGFDYMRVIMALIIIIGHSSEVSYGRLPDAIIYKSIFRAPVAAIMPMFFALSGFLVAASLDRCKTLTTFIGLRVLRIVPALTGEVLLSALILGPVLTSYPLEIYFSDTKFLTYFFNIIGDIHYKLPGLFLNNPSPEVVNAQLWTIPFELISYGLLLLLSITRLFKYRHGVFIAVILFYLLQFTTNYQVHPRAWTVVGNTLVMSSLAGIVFYCYRDVVPWNFSIFLATSLLSIVLLSSPDWDIYVAFPAAYASIYLGLLNPPRHKYLLSGDYSYGLYLYGLVIQQAVASLGPFFRQWYWNLLFAIPLTSLAAFMSWWIIEKPALRLRSYLK